MIIVSSITITKLWAHPRCSPTGNVFGERDTHFRICYTVPDAKLKEGAENHPDRVRGRAETAGR